MVHDGLLPRDEGAGMREAETLAGLRQATRDKDCWPEQFSWWLSLLAADSLAVRAKALWLIGEAGLAYTELLTPSVFESVSRFTRDSHALSRARAATALGRMGRGCPSLVKPYIETILSLLSDADAEVRLSAIWACENIASSAPELIAGIIGAFEPLLSDGADRVRMEAPEVFRVMGRRLPLAVLPYRDRLLALSENDENRVVRVHALGAVKAMDKANGG